MPDRTALPLCDIENFVSQHPNWRYNDNRLSCTYRFASFRLALEWMQGLVDCIELADHHPDWCNTYNRVFVTLWTHDMGAVTELDIALAKEMENAYTILLNSNNES